MKAYETTVASNFTKHIKEIQAVAEESFALQTGDFVETGARNVFKIKLSDDRTPQWDLPIHLVDPRTKETYYLIDTRSFENEKRVSRHDELTNAIERARLERTWNETPAKLAPMAGAIVAAYSDWIIGMVRSRYNLDEVQQSKLGLWVAFFYYVQMMRHEGTRVTGSDLMVQFERFAVRSLRVAAPVLPQVFPEDVVKTFSDAFDTDAHVAYELDFYVTLAKEIIDSPALKDFGGDTIVLFASAGSWGGFAAPVIAAGAAEYPPLFIHMAHQALIYNLRRKTRVGQSVEGLKRKRIDTSVISKIVGSLDEF